MKDGWSLRAEVVLTGLVVLPNAVEYVVLLTLGDVEVGGEGTPVERVVVISIGLILGEVGRVVVV